MLCWGSDQIVIVYVPRACTKKNLESIPPIILFLGHIFLVSGYIGVFGLKRFCVNFFSTFFETSNYLEKKNSVMKKLISDF